MIYSNEIPTLPESDLSKTLNRLDACLKMCISDMRTEKGFQLMCGALNEEFTDLLFELEDKASKYKQQMPRYREEPLDVDWQKVSKQIRTHIECLYSHSLYGETRLFDTDGCFATTTPLIDVKVEKDFKREVVESQPSSMKPIPPELPKLLNSKLKKIAELLDVIDETLNSYTDGEMYSEYCKSELDYYDKTGFNSHKREITKKLNMQKADKFEKYCKTERNKLVKELREINEDFADESGIIDLESIGRYIWGKHTNHDDDPKMKNGTPYTITDIMRIIKSADHYESRANGTAVRITDGNMLKVQEYILPMGQYATPGWRLMHQRLWTYILTNKALIPHFTYKLTSRAEFTSFDLPFVHNVIRTLQEKFDVYVPFDNKGGHPSIKKLNEVLVFEGKGDIGAHRTALSRAVEEDEVLTLIESVVKEVMKSSTT